MIWEGSRWTRLDNGLNKHIRVVLRFTGGDSEFRDGEADSGGNVKNIEESNFKWGSFFKYLGADWQWSQS